jgi:hypothetical protein
MEMRSASTIAAAAGLLLVLVSAAAGQQGEGSADGRSWFETFRETWEAGGQGWTFEDRSGRPSDFHVSQYLAYDDGEEPNYSYWCGSFDYDANGGYGDGWNGILELPEIDVPSGRNPPVLRFKYRICSDQMQKVPDRAWVEVKDGGEYRLLWDYAGPTCSWVTQPPIFLEPYDEPLKLRFRFRSGGDKSDEDGVFDSDGGAFHVDEIRVHEFGTGENYFYDDVEDGVGFCTSVDVPGGGLAPHVIEAPCRAYSGTHCVTVTPPGDTTFVPPNVFCSITSPPVHVDWAELQHCMLYYAGGHYGYGDRWDERVYQLSVDDGETWKRVAENTWVVTEHEFCKEFSQFGLAGYDIAPHLPAYTIRLRLSVLTDETGIETGAGGVAGSFLDDIWCECSNWTGVQEQEASWGTIKAMFR